MRHTTKGLSCFQTLVAILVIGFLIYLLLPAIQGSREAARYMQCKGNMEQIGIALRNYHDHFGSFPPAYTVDAEGKPLHSWRTLIIPYFDAKAIDPKWKAVYDKIRFDEPWNSEYNIQFCEYLDDTEEQKKKYHYDPDVGLGFHHNMPTVYGCPNYSNEVVETVYKMVVGENAVGNLHGTSLSQIKRPYNKTVLVVEAGLPVPWMSPSDFTLEDFETAIYPNDSDKVLEMRMVKIRDEEGYSVYRTLESELKGRQILGGNHARLSILFTDGTVNTYKDWKLPISEIKSMSYIRE